MRKLSEIYLLISPSRFHFLKFILEAYDNIATLSSYDSSRGIVVVRFPMAMASDLTQLLESLAPQLSQQVVK